MMSATAISPVASSFLLCLSMFLSLPSWSLVEGSSKDSQFPSLSDTVNRHTVFSQPLTEGVYSFTSDGFIPPEPLVRIRKIHKEMIHSIQSIDDQKKQVKYLLTLSNTANDDLKKLKQKIELSNLGDFANLDKTSLKADVFILLVSHVALVSNSVLYFPDILHVIIRKNPEFEQHIKWVMEFTTDTKIVNDESLLKLFNLAQQEIGLIEKDPDYQNPYKTNRVVLEPPRTTTKKPRKRLQRGPRLSGGGGGGGEL